MDDAALRELVARWRTWAAYLPRASDPYARAMEASRAAAYEQCADGLEQLLGEEGRDG